jgi:hypothetical protein
MDITDKLLNNRLLASFNIISWDVFDKVLAEALRTPSYPASPSRSASAFFTETPLVILGNGSFCRATFAGKRWFNYEDISGMPL